MIAAAIQYLDASPPARLFWTGLDTRLQDAGLTRAQVQAVWIKEADSHPTEGFPGYAQKLQGELSRLVQLLAGRFPNLKLVYLSSRTYGGYARNPLNPEPYAFESGFAVKWLIEQQIKGDPALNYDPAKGPVKAPWLSWGPYLWANGVVKRADGLAYEERDFRTDGTHQSASGQQKVGRQLLQFFKTDLTARPWFLPPGRNGAQHFPSSIRLSPRLAKLSNPLPNGHQNAKVVSQAFGDLQYSLPNAVGGD
jgi:hypothetical protein